LMSVNNNQLRDVIVIVSEVATTDVVGHDPYACYAHTRVFRYDMETDTTELLDYLAAFKGFVHGETLEDDGGGMPNDMLRRDR
jgi:hypothetical protein